MRRGRGSAEEVEIDKSWLDSYADAITLLMAFFVMLFAFSLVDKKKFDDFKFGVYEAFGKDQPAIDGGLGLLDRGNGLSPGIAIPPVNQQEADGKTQDERVSGEVTESQKEQLREQLQQGLDKAGVSDEVRIEEDPRGLVLRFSDKVLFDSGRALIREQGAVALAHVSEVLRHIDNLIVIEGHTDNVPTTGTDWPTNWELSVARATHVLRWLVEGRDIPAPRVSAAGYADTRPRAPNVTEEGRNLNRRVEIVIPIAKDAEVDGQEEEVLG